MTRNEFLDTVNDWYELIEFCNDVGCSYCDDVYSEESMNDDKVIWAIKGSPSLNSDCAVLLREGFRSSKIRLLVTEYDADTLLGDIRGYNSLTPLEKTRLQMPYVHTTLLIDELVKLQHEESGGRVRIYERAGMRKDRYSSLSYNYYVALQIENKMNRNKVTDFDSNNFFMFKAPKIK